MKVLGIESSCDETAAAIVEDGFRMLSNVVQSQIDIHAHFGGVVPEIAARSHIEAIDKRRIDMSNAMKYKSNQNLELSLDDNILDEK